MVARELNGDGYKSTTRVNEVLPSEDDVAKRHGGGFVEDCEPWGRGRWYYISSI